MYCFKVSRQTEKSKPIDHHSTDNFEHIRLLLVAPEFGDGASTDRHGDVPFSHGLRRQRLHGFDHFTASHEPTTAGDGLMIDQR